MIELVDSDIVYRNPKPYLRSIQARHPSLARFDDGELLIAFDLGQTDESLDYRTYRARSLDGGKSWQLEGALFANPGGRPTSYSVRISRAGSEVLAFGSLHYRDDPDEGLVNRATLGFVPTDLILLRSLDRGHTWSPPQPLQPAIESPAWETCHHVVPLPSGRWLAPTATWRGWDGRHPAGEQTVVSSATTGDRAGRLSGGCSMAVTRASFTGKCQSHRSDAGVFSRSPGYTIHARWRTSRTPLP